MASELVARVSKIVGVVLVPVSIVGGVLAGWPGAIGALAGGLLSLASLHWVARGARSAAGFFSGGRAHPMWVFALALRYTLLFGAVGLLLWSGLVHPVALIAGLSILPPVLIAAGLRSARSLS
jgi:hypothetical protein